MGCTTAAFYTEDGLVVFKNCDLTVPKLFHKPKIMKDGYRRIELRRKGRPGPWAGINERGLGLVASDFHSRNDKKYKPSKKETDGIFRCYSGVLASCKNEKEAIRVLADHYKSVTSPDIVLIASPGGAIAAEFMPEHGWRYEEITTEGKFIVRSNTPRNFSRFAATKINDASSWLREERAVELLGKELTINTAKKICIDHSNGPGDNSICRHGTKGGYKTRASAIMVAGKKIGAWHVINSSPCSAQYTWAEL